MAKRQDINYPRHILGMDQRHFLPYEEESGDNSGSYQQSQQGYVENTKENKETRGNTKAQGKEETQEMDDNKEKRATSGLLILTILTTLALWAMLLIVKAAGLITWSWTVTVLGIVWIPWVEAALLLLSVAISVMITRVRKSGKEYARRHRIAKQLDATIWAFTLNSVGEVYNLQRKPRETDIAFESRIASKAGAPVRTLPSYPAMERLTLCSIGPLYGIKEQSGEGNDSYKRRILKAARIIDIVNLNAAKKEEEKPEPRAKQNASLEELRKFAKKQFGLVMVMGETENHFRRRVMAAVDEEYARQKEGPEEK